MNEELKELPTLQRMSKMGRPEYWTVERVSALCEKLKQWADLETSITLAEFRAQEEVHFKQIKWIKSKYPDFAAAYDLTREKLAARIARKMGRGVHPLHYQRYVALYDSELQEHDIDSASLKAAASIKANEQIVEAGKKIVDSLNSALSQSDS